MLIKISNLLTVINHLKNMILISQNMYNMEEEKCYMQTYLKLKKLLFLSIVDHSCCGAVGTSDCGRGNKRQNKGGSLT